FYRAGLMDILNNIAYYVCEGNAKLVSQLVNEALKSNIDPQIILNEGLIKGMSIAGDKFIDSSTYVPEVLVAARAMSIGLEIIKPYLVASNVKPIGRVVIGTVKGDLHDIGKNLVIIFLKGAGIETIDLGIDVSVDKFIDAVKKYNPNILAMSALLTTTMHQMKEVIDKLHAEGIREKVKVMIGGAPITQDFANEIGADLFAEDAATAAKIARNIILGKSKQ
ncbi:corrinoid protein, partial [Caldicellulosiruptoraceae bacterium PP1]